MRCIKSFIKKYNAVIPSIDLVPVEMLKAQVFKVWKSWLYLLELRKP
jgi:hypothetical protein